MAFFLILVGMLIGGAAFMSSAGVIFGGAFGYLAAWAIKLGRRISGLEARQHALHDDVQRLQRALGATEPERPAAKAAPVVTQTVSRPFPEPQQEPTQPEVRHAAKVPPERASGQPADMQPGVPEQPQPKPAPSFDAVTPPPKPVTAEPEGSNILGDLVERWIFKGNPLVKVGGAVLFLGLAFALRYAAELGLLPLWLRYSAVAASGIALLGLGWRWREREDNYGLVLQGIGIGILYLTTLAAMKLHPLLPLGVGFTLLVLIAAAAVALAITEDAMILAVVATLGGFAAPVLASTGIGNHILLFSYLAVLNLGIVAVAWFKRWRVLNILGYVCSFGLGSAWAVNHYRDELFWSTEPFLLLLFGSYVLVTVLFARRTLADVGDSDDWTFGDRLRKTSGQVKYVDGSLAFGVPLSAFSIQHLLVAPYEYGAAISALGFSLFYFALAFAFVKSAGPRFALLNQTLVALGAVFGTVSVPLLETSWTASAWAIEAAGIYWIGVRQQQFHVRLFALAVLLGAMAFFLPELHRGDSGTVLGGPFLGTVMLAGSGGFAYWLMWRALPEHLTTFERNARPVVGALSAAVLATLPLLLLEAEWAGAVLSVAGAGLIYLSRGMPDRAVFGAGWFYQLAGGLLVAASAEPGISPAFFNSGFATALTIALAGVTCGYLVQHSKRDALFAYSLGWAGICWGGLWWAFAWMAELHRSVPATSVSASLIAVTLLSAWACSAVAKRLNWTQLGQAALAYLAVLVLLGVHGVSGGATHPGQGWGAIAWPAALIVHGLLLKQRLSMIDRRLLGQAHVIGVWLFVGLGSIEVHWWMQHSLDRASAWPLLGAMLLPTAYVWSITSRKVRDRWPVSDYPNDYILTAAFPLVAFMLLWLWVTNATSPGAVPPVPYVPVLNPLELGYLAVLGSVFYWWPLVAGRVRVGKHEIRATWPLAATAFAAVTGGVVRACHHWAGVRWHPAALFASDTVQAALSIVWGVLAISLMLLGNRRRQRSIWLTGASLVAVVVVKLFLVELSAVGTLQRIVSFVGVGLLLLLVGYIAPLPPKKDAGETA